MISKFTQLQSLQNLQIPENTQEGNFSQLQPLQNLQTSEKTQVIKIRSSSGSRMCIPFPVQDQDEPILSKSRKITPSGSNLSFEIPSLTLTPSMKEEEVTLNSPRTRKISSPKKSEGLSPRDFLSPRSRKNSPDSDESSLGKKRLSKSLENLFSIKDSDSSKNLIISPRAISELNKCITKKISDNSNIKLDFSKINNLEGKLGEQFDKDLKLEEWTEKKESICNETEVKNNTEILLVKFAREKAETILQNLFKDNDFNDHVLDIIRNVQNELISSTTIYDKLCESRKALIKALQSYNTYTTYTRFLYEIFDKLLVLSNPSKKPTGKEFSKFLECVQEIRNKKYHLYGETLNKKFNEKLEPIISSFFGNNEESCKRILEILHEWNNPTLQAEKYRDTIRSLAFASIAENISRIEHYWKKKVKNEYSVKYLFDNYLEMDFPVKVNGSIIDKSKLENENAFISQLIIKLCAGFDLESPDENKLSQEITQACSQFSNDKNIFSENTFKCLDILHLATYKFEASSYLIERLIGLFENEQYKNSPFYIKNTWKSLEFNLDKNEIKNSYVEYLGNIQICHDSSSEQPVYYNIPLTFKIFFPEDEMANCILKLHKIEVAKNDDPEKIKTLEMAFLNLKDNAFIKEKFPGIKIEYR
jgi:hypothetical protein